MISIFFLDGLFLFIFFFLLMIRRFWFIPRRFSFIFHAIWSYLLINFQFILGICCLQRFLLLFIIFMIKMILLLIFIIWTFWMELICKCINIKIKQMRICATIQHVEKHLQNHMHLWSLLLQLFAINNVLLQQTLISLSELE